MTFESHQAGLQGMPSSQETAAGATRLVAGAEYEVTSETVARERDLVARLLVRDAAAWQEFVERFHRLVLARIYAVAREAQQAISTDDAEDACADVFSQLVDRDFSMLRGFAFRSSLSTWLCVVTRRIGLRRLARQWREPSRPATTDSIELEQVTCREDEPLAVLLRDERFALLRQSLRQLSVRDQQLIRYFFLDGCSYREISQHLKIPMNSIGPTLQRVQSRLRALAGIEE